MTIKKGTLTQFTEAETLAARNEADNFDFNAAWHDWRTQPGGRIRHRFLIAELWFIAGIALGKKLVLTDIARANEIENQL